MTKHKSSNPPNVKTHQKTICLKEVNESEEAPVCDLDLPLFITTSEQREVMNKAMIKAKAIEKSRTEAESNKAP